MREEARKRLERLGTKAVYGWVSVIAGLGLLLAGFLTFHVWTGAERHVAGTVQSADWRLNDDTGQHYPFIEVKLDGGGSVRVGSVAPALPTVGDRITLRQRAMLFDYMKVYEWDGPPPASAAPAPTPISHP